MITEAWVFRQKLQRHLSCANLARMRAILGLRPTAEFDPDRPARVYDNLNRIFVEWDPQHAEHYRQTARPYRQKD